MTRTFSIGWRQVATGFMLLAASGMIASTYSLIAIPIAREFHPTRMVLMLTMTVLSGMGAILTPILGMLMDRVSVRRLMLLGGCSLAAGYAAMSFATSFGQILVIFAVLIAPANVLIGPVAVTVLLSRWFVERRGRAIGMAIAGISAGAFTFPLVVQALLNGHDWRQALQLFSLILLLWTIPAAWLAIDRPADRNLLPDGAAEHSAQARAEMAAAPISARAILTDPAFWMIATTVAIVTAGLKGMVTNLAPLAIDNGIAASRAAFFISIYAASSFVAKLSFAMLADRLAPRILMAISLGGFSIGMACLTQAEHGAGIIMVGIICAGLAGGLMVPIESLIAPRVFGQHAVGRAMGLLSGTILLGMLSTPPLFGLIFDLTGSYMGIFWTFCGLAIAGLVALPTLRLHPRTGMASVGPAAV